MSVQDGCSISGTAESIDLRVFDASVALAGTIPPVAYDYVVSAQISLGQRPNIQQPALLDLMTVPITLAPGATGVFDILAALVALNVDGFGGIVSMNTYCGPTPLASINPAVAAAAVPSGIVAVTQDSLGVTELEFHDPREITGWVPIIPGATRLNFVVGANSPASFRFYTVFGVDG
jgi:hypothetical protein